jgi:hypothetical protein
VEAVEGLLSGLLTFEEAALKFRQVDTDTKLARDGDKNEEAQARCAFNWVRRPSQDPV